MTMTVTVNSHTKKNIFKKNAIVTEIKMIKVTHKKQNKETGSRKSQKMRSVLKQQTAPVKTHRTVLRQETNQEGQYERGE